MKIRIIPQGNGFTDLYFQRTRPSEARNVFLKYVASAALRSTLEREIKKMRKEIAVESLGGF